MVSWSGYTITQGFGPTSEPLDSGYMGYAHFNKGLDFGIPEGTAIDIPVSGTVISAGDSGDGWGISVKVRDENGYTHNFGHLSGVNVKAGDTVKAGAVVGYSGNTGASTGPHLSYDVYDPSGTFIDPSGFLGQEVQMSFPMDGTLDPDDFGMEAEQIKDLLDSLMMNVPELSDYESPTEWLADLQMWKDSIQGVADTYKTLKGSSEGWAELPDGTVVALGDLTPEQREAVRSNNENIYRKALNDYNLSEYDLRSKATQDERERLQDDFENKMDLFNADIDFDQLNLSRASAEISRFLEGKAEARARAQLIQDEKEVLQKWGTAPGKSSFTGEEMGGAVSFLMNLVGVNPKSTAISFPGTTHIDVEGDLNRLDTGLGVAGPLPTVPSLITNPSNKPAAPVLPAGPQIPSLLPPSKPSAALNYTTSTTPGNVGTNPNEPQFVGGNGIVTPGVTSNINIPLGEYQRNEHEETEAEKRQRLNR